MSAEMDALVQSVTNENTVIDSAITLLAGLAAQITDTAGDKAATLALAKDVQAKADVLAAAVTANTPAVPVDPNLPPVDPNLPPVDPNAPIDPNAPVGAVHGLTRDHKGNFVDSRGKVVRDAKGNPITGR
jgi:hypothetical protein